MLREIVLEATNLKITSKEMLQKILTSYNKVSKMKGGSGFDETNFEIDEDEYGIEITHKERSLPSIDYDVKLGYLTFIQFPRKTYKYHKKLDDALKDVESYLNTWY